MKSNNLHLNLNSDESYDLIINTRVQGEFPRDEIIVHISSSSYYGARQRLHYYMNVRFTFGLQNVDRL